MTSTEITNLLLIAQASITFLIAFRAFFLYFRVHSDLLFILTLLMFTIAMVGMLGLITDNYFASSFNTKWYRYGAQIVSYSFIFLCSVHSSESNLRKVKWWQLIFTALLVGVFFLIPLFPQFANPEVEAAVSSLRAIICFVICMNYAALFTKRETRFSFLMGLAFLLICFGIATTTPWYFEPTVVLYLYVGDFLRTLGLITLLAAFLVG